MTEYEKKCNCKGNDSEDAAPGVRICLECGRQWEVEE